MHSAPRILSLAAGHLREADISSAIKSRAISEFVAFDQDRQSLSVISQDYGNGQIVTHHGSVCSLLAGKHSYRDFHFVYAAGLFDYLAQRTAARLTRVMFDALAPGGRLLIANFAPSGITFEQSRALRVLAAIYDAICMLVDHPRAGHVRPDVRDTRYRFWSVYRFVVAYRTDRMPLIIARVVHGSRNFKTLFR